jgi:hypothetical protein
MKPSQIAQALNHIASKIQASKNPDKNLVARDLKKIIAQIDEDGSMTEDDFIKMIEKHLPELKECMGKGTSEENQELEKYMKKHLGLDNWDEIISRAGKVLKTMINWVESKK